MLYKKYHRFYVSQFKKGIKFEFKFAGGERLVTRDPFIKGSCIIILWGDETSNYDLCLVFADGTLEDDVAPL